MPVFTEANLRKFAPHIHQDILRAFLVYNADDILISAGINSALILQHFMGQTFVETDGYETMTENLHYSAERLMQVYGHRHFPSLAFAERYAGNPVKTANYVYGGRMGNNKTGDGWKYRGGGLIDLTGLNNYRSIYEKTGIDIVNNPDLIRDPSTALQIAAQCFKALGAVEAADNDDCKLVSLRINGGYNGLPQREEATRRASDIFTDDPVSSTASDTSSPFGFLSNFETADQTGEGEPLMAVPTPANQIPMTHSQAKQLQQQLKDKNYAPGDINGDISNPSTVGAICSLQKQQGMPVTGVVDDDTEDAIQTGPIRSVSKDRANETAQSLRSKGSKTIAASDSISTAAHGVTAGGLGAIGVGGASILSAIQSQTDQVKSITDDIPGLSDKLSMFITQHIGLIALTAAGGGLVFLASRIYGAARVVVSERVRKSQTGEDMSH